MRGTWAPEMKCPRCGKSNPGASWYCAKCGAPLADLNTADAARRPLRHLRRWGLLAAAILALAGVFAVVAATGLLGRGPSAGDTPDLFTDSAAEPTTTNGPRYEWPTVVARAPAPPTARIVTPVPTPRQRPGTASWTAQRLDSPPELDGRLDEWSGTPIAIDSVVYGSEDWDGPDDTSGHAYAGWDESALYLGVRVTDDVFSQPSTGRRLHLGDGLELQVDADLVGDWTADAYNGDDWHLGLSPGDFDGRPPEAYVWRPFASPADAIELEARLLDDGYVLEAAIPWPLLGVDASTTRGIGIALNISDNDEAAPAQASMVSSAPRRAWSDPRTFGTLILGDSLPE